MPGSTTDTTPSDELPGDRASQGASAGGRSPIEHSEQLLRAIVEHIPHMIFVKDAVTLRFVLFNRAGEDLLGVPRDELLGKSDLDFFPADQAAFFVSKDREVLSNGTPIDIPEEEILSPSLGPRTLHTKKVPLMDDQGRPRYLLGISEDITERKNGEADRRALERRLQLAERMEAVGHLAGGVAHDFNNLLTAIQGYAVMLRDDLPVGSPLRDDVEEIHRAAQRGADVTRQLLAFGRRQVLQPRVLDLNESAAGTARMLRRLIGEDVELVLKPAPQGVLVEADPGQLDQVIMNLAINARDAMPSGGTLTIEAAGVELDPAYAALHDSVVAGSYGMLAVSDTGAGMSKDVQARIFEPFFTTKAMGEGTGLGLATVYGIVKQSGGHIAVYSELGKGTTFRVYLPRAAGKQATPPPAAPPLRHGTETILLVEDDVQLRRLVNRVLKRQGYTVLDADGPERALAIAAEHEGPIALLLTDMVMPGGSGGELARRMLRERPELKVLYTSGYTEEEAILRHGALVPGTDFLQKPSTVEELLRKVRAILDR